MGRRWEVSQHSNKKVSLKSQICTQGCCIAGTTAVLQGRAIGQPTMRLRAPLLLM